MPAKTRKQTAPKRWNHLEAAEIDARVELGPLPWLNRQAYSPDERQRVPAAGAWILVVRPLPPMERDIDLHVRPGCIFYAQRDPNADENGFTADGTYKILLDTPWGTVKLFPHEFARVESDFVLGCWQADELAFHPLHIDAARLNDVVFYAQSRGIPLASAVPMALGTLNGNVGWFEPVPEIAKQAESMAKHSYGFGGLTAVNHRRRAEAKARHSLTPEN